MASLADANPFAKRETVDLQAVWTYKILTLGTWLLTVLVSIYYTFGIPDDVREHGGNTIWGQNKTHPTPFALNSLIASLYWLVVFVLQIAYLWHLYSNDNADVQAAAGVGSHFITNNLLQFGFVLLFVRSHFFWAELLLIINFFNLTLLYFRHNTHSKHLIHMPVVSGPLAWTFLALYWNGAIAVNAHSLPARILANVAIWGILVYGWFFLAVYKDYTMGFALSVLCASLGVGQLLTHTIAFQWIFAFTIMGTLFVSTLLVGVLAILGKELSFSQDDDAVSEDQETAPLLGGN